MHTCAQANTRTHATLLWLRDSQYTGNTTSCARVLCIHGYTQTHNVPVQLLYPLFVRLCVFTGAAPRSASQPTTDTLVCRYGLRDVFACCKQLFTCRRNSRLCLILGMRDYNHKRTVRPPTPERACMCVCMCVSRRCHHSLPVCDTQRQLHAIPLPLVPTHTQSTTTLPRLLTRAGYAFKSTSRCVLAKLRSLTSNTATAISEP